MKDTGRRAEGEGRRTEGAGLEDETYTDFRVAV